MTLSLHPGRPAPQAASPRNLCALRVSALDSSPLGLTFNFQLSTFNRVFLLRVLCGENPSSFRSSLIPRSSPLTTKSFIIRTSETPLPQLLYNPHLQAPLGSAGNKGLITPLESALTKNSPVTSLESALTKTPGVGVGYGDSFTPMTSTNLPRLTSSLSVPLRWSVLGATIAHSQAQVLAGSETTPLLPVSKIRERTPGIARRCPRLAVYPDLVGAVPDRAGRPAHQHRVGKAGSVRLG